MSTIKEIAVTAIDLTVIPAALSDLQVVTNLSRYSIYDMSEHLGWECPETGPFGGCDEFFESWRGGTRDTAADGA